MMQSTALQKRHMGKPEMFTPEVVATALKTSGGLVASAARKLDVARSTVYDYIEKHESVREARDEAREFTLDEAEAELVKAVKRGEPWAICFTLKTVGKHRGFSERVEVENSNTKPITVEILRGVSMDDL